MGRVEKKSNLRISSLDGSHGLLSPMDILKGRALTRSEFGKKE
jgi:hypothetical protein